MTAPSSNLRPAFPTAQRLARQACLAMAMESGGSTHGQCGCSLHRRSDRPARRQTITPGRLSGDLGWVYDLTDTWQLLANLGAGFRAPNIADLGTLGSRPGNRFNIPNTSLDSERVTHGDASGLRRQADRWQFELSLFSLRYTDRIVSVSTGDVTPDGRRLYRVSTQPHRRFTALRPA